MPIWDEEVDENGNVRPPHRALARRSQTTILPLNPDRIYPASQRPAPLSTVRSPSRRQLAQPESTDRPRPLRKKRQTPEAKLRRAVTAGIGAAAATYLPGAKIPDELKSAAGAATGVLIDRAIGLFGALMRPQQEDDEE